MSAPEDGAPTSRQYSGLAIASVFWLWGALLIGSIRYLDAQGAAFVALAVLAFFLALVGLVGGLVELQKRLRREGLGHLAVFALFGLPAAALAILIQTAHLTGGIAVALKISVVVLAFCAVPFIATGFSLLGGRTEAQPVRDPGQTRRERVGTLSALLVSMLAALTAIIGLVDALTKYLAGRAH